MNYLEKNISGLTEKPKIDKTTKDWVSEWFTSLIRARKTPLILIGLFTGSFSLYFLEPFGITVSPILLVIQPMFAVLLFPIVAVIIFLFAVRTIALISHFIFPDIVAMSIETTERGITVVLKNGKKDTVPIKNIESILLLYNYRGVYINSLNKKSSYALPIEPINIEEKIDVLPSLKKEIFPARWAGGFQKKNFKNFFLKK